MDCRYPPFSTQEISEASSFTCPHIWSSQKPSNVKYSSASSYFTSFYGCGNLRYRSREGRQISRFFSGSARDALGGIEATLMAVNGMAEVFNATYHAIYNSLETIFNVLEELTRLKTKIRHMVPLLALWNWLRYIWRFLLSCLKLRKKNSDDMEVVWMGFRNISKQRHSLHNASSVKFRLFSSLIVWLIALGVPYLVYQLLTEMKFQVSESIKWKSQRDQYYEAVATEDHYVEKNAGLSFKYGDTLYIAPKEYQPRKPGYILACIKDGSKIGLVPIKKVRLIKHVSGIPLVFNKRCDTEFRRSVHDSEKHLSD